MMLQRHHTTGLHQRGAGSIIPSRRPGEKHVMLYTPEGWRYASYMGPGTNLKERIRDGIGPVTESDKVAQAHDLRYNFADSHQDIRAADEKMISKLDEISKNKGDYKVNIWQGKYGIKAKMALENSGLAKPEDFTTFGEWKQDSPEDQAMMRGKLTELEQEGFGRDKKTGQFTTWRQHVAEYRKKHPKMSYKQCLKAASKTYRK